MRELNTEKAKWGTPEYAAGMLINIASEELDNMSQEEFENWLDKSLQAEKITFKTTILTVPETEKKAVLHFIAFWYYRNIYLQNAR